jgi:hypothetical protein
MKKTLAVLLFAFSPVLIPFAHAQYIGVNFSGGVDSQYGGGSSLGVLVDPTKYAGLYPQLNFNNVNPNGNPNSSDSTLVNSNDVSLPGISVAWTGPDTYASNYGTSTNNGVLLSNFLDSGIADSSVTVSGLADGTYTLLLYIAGDQPTSIVRGGTYTINGTSYILADDGASTDTQNGVFDEAVAGNTEAAAKAGAGNYFQTTFTISSLTPDLTITTSDQFTSGGDGSPRAVIDGFQIVPEPSTWAMLLGGVGLLGFCIRRKVA